MLQATSHIFRTVSISFFWAHYNLAFFSPISTHPFARDHLIFFFHRYLISWRTIVSLIFLARSQFHRFARDWLILLTVIISFLGALSSLSLSTVLARSPLIFFARDHTVPPHFFGLMVWQRSFICETKILHHRYKVLVTEVINRGIQWCRTKRWWVGWQIWDI